ncbi:MAG TPA: GNAT family N-acetyltransferase [Bryobacteraceae bacterium]|nr:GNAT family N-acetyltransferase [Bryobacteraceae bacterium]
MDPTGVRGPTEPLLIRSAIDADAPAIWSIMEPIIREEQTYALPRDLTAERALEWWRAPGHLVFVAELSGVIVGTYFLRANPEEPEGVANCGYMTAPSANGRGVGRAMCAHSLERAVERGFTAMQFNFVVSSNTRAVKLWGSMGFETVRTLAGAFNHPMLGRVDALVMRRRLDGKPSPPPERLFV